jgi:hypothetical protein
LTPFNFYHLNHKHTIMDKTTPNNAYDQIVEDKAVGCWLNGSVIFHRDFRFTLHAKGFDKSNQWVKKVNYNLVPRQIEVEYYDISMVEGEKSINPLRDYINVLLQDDNTDHITLKDYDGCGNVIGTVEFDGCSLVEHHCDYDFGSSEAVTHTLIFEYDFAKFV